MTKEIRAKPTCVIKCDFYNFYEVWSWRKNEKQDG